MKEKNSEVSVLRTLCLHRRFENIVWCIPSLTKLNILQKSWRKRTFNTSSVLYSIYEGFNFYGQMK